MSTRPCGPIREPSSRTRTSPSPRSPPPTRPAQGMCGDAMTIAQQTRPVEVAPLGSTEGLQWLTPAPLWDSGSIGAGAANLTQPFIAEFSSDKWAKEFPAMLAGTSGSPADLTKLAPQATVDGTTAGA